MFQMTNALKAWGTPVFSEVLASSIEELDADLLPLQDGLTRSDFTTGANRKVKVLKLTDDDRTIHARAGIFYTGLLADSHCEDNPQKNAEVSEYCEIEFDIDKKTADTEATLL
jgi:hypothetical protein